MIYDSASRLVIEEWLKLYQRSPKVTASISIISLCVAFVAGAVTYERMREVREARRLENQSYAKQVESLDQVRSNLNALIDFVDTEKRQLQLSERAVSTMKSEHERLKPLVEADRKVIDALLSAQEARNQDAQSKERWIGFGLGVLASFIASIAWAATVYVIKKKNLASSV